MANIIKVVVDIPVYTLIVVERDNGRIKFYNNCSEASKERLCNTLTNMANDHFHPWRRPYISFTPNGFKAEW